MADAKKLLRLLKGKEYSLYVLGYFLHQRMGMDDQIVLAFMTSSRSLV